MMRWKVGVSDGSSREASNSQNFCDPFVRTGGGLTFDPFPFPRETRTHCCHSARLPHCAFVSFPRPQWVLPREETKDQRTHVREVAG